MTCGAMRTMGRSSMQLPEIIHTPLKMKNDSDMNAQETWVTRIGM
jgi:hypothetical protein